jgi:hypothetical protein
MNLPRPLQVFQVQKVITLMHLTDADEDLVWQQFDLTSGQTNHFLGCNSKRTPRYLPRGDSHPLPLALDNQDLENHLQENEPTHVIY